MDCYPYYESVRMLSLKNIQILFSSFNRRRHSNVFLFLEMVTIFNSGTESSVEIWKPSVRIFLSNSAKQFLRSSCLKVFLFLGTLAFLFSVNVAILNGGLLSFVLNWKICRQPSFHDLFLFKTQTWSNSDQRVLRRSCLRGFTILIMVATSDWELA